MNIIIFLLSFVLVLACLFLILLVLVQLPKKEAGLGQAFGASTTDTLFGPGSGNMLTKLTKWTAIVFFVLTLSIWIMQARGARGRNSDLRSKLTPAEKAAADARNMPAPTPVQTNQGTNLIISPGTNAPGTNTVPTNPPAK